MSVQQLEVGKQYYFDVRKTAKGTFVKQEPDDIDVDCWWFESSKEERDWYEVNDNGLVGFNVSGYIWIPVETQQ